jgi:hypothetical protein
MRRHKDGQGPMDSTVYTMSTRSPPLVSPERLPDPTWTVRAILLLSLWTNAFAKLFAIIRFFLPSMCGQQWWVSFPQHLAAHYIHYIEGGAGNERRPEFMTRSRDSDVVRRPTRR